jgi:TM2 domain-containing membrane protein YozV
MAKNARLCLKMHVYKFFKKKKEFFINTLRKVLILHKLKTKKLNMKKLIRLSFLAITLVVATVSTTDAAFPKDKETTSVVSVAASTSNDELTTAIAELKKETTTTAPTTSNKFAGGSKSKIVAALLAFFLGLFGVHSFYMGNKKKGLIQLGLGVLGLVLTIVGLASAVTSATTGTVAIPTLAIIGYLLLVGVSIWAFVDFIRILTGGLAPEEGFED